MKQILGSIGQVAERYASRKPEEDKDGGGYAGREALDDWFFFHFLFQVYIIGGTDSSESTNLCKF